MVKPWASLDEQIEKLIKRGLTDAPDFAEVIERVGYYRLSGYTYPFRIADETAGSRRHHRNHFRPGVSMQHIVDLYQFDEDLRLATWQATRQVEIVLRAQIGLIVGEYDPLLHEHLVDLWSGKRYEHEARRFSERANSLIKRSKEEFVQHHVVKHGGQLPIWALTEILDFGSLVSFLRLTPSPLRIAVADRWGCRGDEIGSWLRTMNLLRNISAHHARLWNKVITIRPMTKHRERTAMFRDTLSNSGKPFASLSILSYVLNEIGLETEQQILRRTLQSFPSELPALSIDMMGASNDWDSVPVWR